jgi:hypothetical protein
MGLLNHPPGITIMGIRYTLEVGSGVAITLGYTWGILVTDSGVASSVINPSSKEHLDFMEWGQKTVGLSAATPGSVAQLVGNGDDGFRTVRSRRRLNEMFDNLAFVIVSDSATATSYNVGISVHFALP